MVFLGFLALFKDLFERKTAILEGGSPWSWEGEILKGVGFGARWAVKKSMGVKRVKRRTKREQKACVLLTKKAKITSWRGGRVAEGDGLLNRYTA